MLIALTPIALAVGVFAFSDIAANVFGYMIALAFGFALNRHLDLLLTDGCHARAMLGKVLAFATLYMFNLSLRLRSAKQLRQSRSRASS
ncbi:hypothetical protein [Bradyrhizobium iriomotense]|uniref:hypothetical protein n=1 Tax=Bradyrhizobium iriomotense TaxID=441950 RepID=UPI001B8A28C6|nr:hypothetical protein [Bradyrhizobium iriomotense]MBR1133273.1 hypothetical protein [Bradyrhizobium iriomotense]